MNVARLVGPTQAPTGFAGLIVGFVNLLIQGGVLFSIYSLTVDQLAYLNTVLVTGAALVAAVLAWRKATPAGPLPTTIPGPTPQGDTR